MKQWMNRIIAVLLIIPLSGCSLVQPHSGNEGIEVSDSEIREVVSRAIDQNWEHIAAHLEGIPETARSAAGSVDADMVIDMTLQEEQGEEYLSFCYSIATGADVDTILGQAQQLLPQETYDELLESIDESTRTIYRSYEARIFSIDDDNRAEFFHDLQKLVVSTTVLLTASIVYTAMPHIFFWGKISALAAVSVSAGAVAGTLMSVYTWYETSQSYDMAFKQWLTMITEEPYAAYLMVTSVIGMGQAMQLSPVSCGVILGVFTLFNVLNILREMLETYGDE
ncbi:MAG: hypothetical protein K9M84_06710 [Spirochaetia bacterium]|nr:hypothetical protein [Spirochaetia bacterium]